MICTWVGCKRTASQFKAAGDNHEAWASLCEEHYELLDTAENDFLFNGTSPKLLLAYWIKAQGGSKKVAERMVEDAMR